MNAKPFEYHSSNGTIFTSDHCDFRGGVKVEQNISETDRVFLQKEIAGAVAEMISYHTINIFPNLNGFQGYDCIDFNF